MLEGGRGMPCITGTTHYHTQLGLTDKGRAIKWFVVCYSLDLEPLDLLNGLAPEVVINRPPELCKVFKRGLRHD